MGNIYAKYKRELDAKRENQVIRTDEEYAVQTDDISHRKFLQNVFLRTAAS